MNLKKSRKLAMVSALGLAVSSLIGLNVGGASAAASSVSATITFDKPYVVRDGGITASLALSATFGTDTSVSDNQKFNTLTQGYEIKCADGTTVTATTSRILNVTETTYSNKRFSWSSSTGAGGTVTAVDGKAAATDVISGSAPDGQKTYSLSVTAKQDKTVVTKIYTEYKYSSRGTTCTSQFLQSAGTPVTAGDDGATTTFTKNYLVDLLPGTVTGKINPSSDFVEEGQAMNTTLSIEDGSANTKIEYTIRATATSITSNPALTLSKNEEGYVYFEGKGVSFFSNSATGVADKHAISSGSMLPCGLPLGVYAGTAYVTTYDIAGNAFPVSEIPIGSTTVRAASNLSADNFVVAQMADGSYGAVDSFSVTQTRKKGTSTWSSNIGAVHFGALLTTPGRCQMEGATYTLDGSSTSEHLVLEAPTGFEFVRTGQTFAHTFAGFLAQGATLDYHEGNLSRGEVTGSAPETTYNAVGTVVSGTTYASKIVINLKALGMNAADFKIYVRAKMQYTGAGAATAGARFMFTDRVDNFNASTPAVTATNKSSFCLPYFDGTNYVYCGN